MLTIIAGRGVYSSGNCLPAGVRWVAAREELSPKSRGQLGGGEARPLVPGKGEGRGRQRTKAYLKVFEVAEPSLRFIIWRTAAEEADKPRRPREEDVRVKGGGKNEQGR